ncbi:uncharacterized protein LOC133176434 [Saccostrea echinata]|uniref:uncharacterized protein LOC133176434 n=1 Tax=Saccostrea echinata TaxID=191078 RepID=UPI002A81130E|nr:uncharacterized protein LOC133176434 [Saccostrea echinata]
MAVCNSKYPVGSPQEHIQMCENHGLPIDLVCEDCHIFICSTCAKTDHSGHNWVTQGVAASQRRKGLLKFLRDIKEVQLPKVDERIIKKKAENERTCESQMKNVEKHFNEIIAKLTDIRDRKEEVLKSNLRKKNEHLAIEKSRMDKEKKQLIEMVKYTWRRTVEPYLIRTS